ncbi:MAG: hypothetical protein GOV00_04340 [Candidatus Altiarchaeota archaeon]|nr:hypothetical protein [Candidatus Altiarchaeota archaeon]
MADDFDFIQPDEKKKLVVVKINPKLYPIDIIYSASYSVMEKAFVMLEGSLDEKVYVVLKLRNFKGTLEELGQLFYDELNAAAFYAVQLARSQGVREALIHGLSQASPLENMSDSEESIGQLWEEKFGEANEGSSE